LKIERELQTNYIVEVKKAKLPRLANAWEKKLRYYDSLAKLGDTGDDQEFIFVVRFWDMALNTRVMKRNFVTKCRIGDRLERVDGATTRISVESSKSKYRRNSSRG